MCSAPDPDSGLARGCFSAGGKRIEREVVRLFLERATPAGAEADLRRWEQGVQHCRYEAGLAERRYRQVDPDNRLVAATLEGEWERAEVALKEAEQALAAARAERREPRPPEFFAELGNCLRCVWDAPTTSNWNPATSPAAASAGCMCGCRNPARHCFESPAADEEG